LGITLFLVTLGLLLNALMKRGKVRLASYILVIILEAFAVTMSILGGGMTGPAMSFLILVILIAGLLLGGRAALIFLGVSFLSCAGLAYAETYLILPPPIAPMTIPFRLVIYSTYFALAGLLLFLADRNIRNAMNQARQKEHELSLEIAERREIENKLQDYAQELERSNKELQQFAYVASHDLQEPLRMITSYLQLLERRYRHLFDETAIDFIHYSIDGAKRMQSLLEALLAYSRVGTRGGPMRPVNTENIMSDVQENLRFTIDDTRAQIVLGELPTINGDEHQLMQLFQNLVGNALKYRGAQTPIIKIQATADNGHVKFSIEDNGIGIQPEYKDRIFLIFQRLHTQEEYPGTGIGLAICKRIVERHGGKIWIESDGHSGTTFFFTIPSKSKGNI
jgi:signal transduction histidine kinase